VRDVPACSAGRGRERRTACTAGQADAIAKVYSGPISNGKPFFPGFMPGSEAVMPHVRRRRRQRLAERHRRQRAQPEAGGLQPGREHDAVSGADAA
jgi:hypothetical protein